MNDELGVEEVVLCLEKTLCRKLAQAKESQRFVPLQSDDFDDRFDHAGLWFGERFKVVEYAVEVGTVSDPWVGVNGAVFD